MNPRDRICPQCLNHFTASYANEVRKFCSKACAALFNKPSNALLISDEANMSRRTKFRRKRAAGLTQPVFRFPFKETFFDKWSDELAWTLGLIWSDGHLYRNTINITSNDYEMLSMVEAFIEMPNGIRPKNKGQSWYIAFTSKKVADWMRQLGLTPNKSFTKNFPQIPEEYRGAFVRGYFDGNGTVSERNDREGQQVTDIRVAWYTASPDFRDGLVECLKEQGIVARWRISHTTVFAVQIVKQSDLRQLHGFMYPSEDVCCLLRKRVPYEVWMKTPRVRPGRPSPAHPPIPST